MSTGKTDPIRGRRPGERRLIGVALALLLPVAGCGDGNDVYPSGDWSGRYGTTVSQAATDCYGATAPPPMTGFILDLEHHRNNRATLTMNPVVRLAGEFDGDRLEAWNQVETPVELPDSLLARVTEADSLETITYRLEADFSRNGFVGRYVIRAPDLRALVSEGAASRCEFRYRLAGQRIREATESGLPPGFEPVLPDTAPANDPAVVPADTAGS
ncbi:MAG: hypothetical protein ACREMD_01710 [Gemmatimonadota bacterium]